MTQKAYTADSIKTLDIIQAIRNVPGMYIGSDDDDGVEVILREVIDNSIDEYMNGHGKTIFVTINPTSLWMSVEDQGRGIPVEEHSQHKGISTLEAVLTKAHTGGKFASEYGVTGGLHGTGLKAMTALSTDVVATVWRNGTEYTLTLKDAKRVGKIESTPLAKKDLKKTGTRIAFKLSQQYMKEATSLIAPIERVQRLLKERAFLNIGVTVNLQYGDAKYTFSEKDGIAAYVREMSNDKLISASIFHTLTKPEEEIQVEAAIGWTTMSGRDNITGYCNSIRQSEGGTHIQGVRMSVPGLLRAYITANDLIPKKDKDLTIESNDCFEGAIAIVSVKHMSPTFKGQHKGRVTNGDIQGAVQRLLNATLSQWMEENPKEARLIANKVISAARARIAASKAREQVRKQDAGTFGMKNFGKLKDCSSKNPEETEVFIVEGESAGGSAGMSRDRRTQAIYSLKGKPLNAWDCDQTKILSNNELSDLSCAIGTGLFTDDMSEEDIDLAVSKLRYNKIVILADADIDGSHIECLLMGFLYRHMLPLIERGHVYIGLPPLYRVTEKGKHTFLKDDAALGDFLRARAVKVVGDNESLLVLAAKSADIKHAIENIASAHGYTSQDIAHAMRAIIAYDSNAEDWLTEFAKSIKTLREEECEGVTLVKHNADTYIVSGLDASYRFFTTIVNTGFYNAVVEAWSQVEALAGNDALIELLNGAVIDDEYTTIYDLAAGIEKLIKKGLSVQRNKGLGEMQAEDLGETTLDQATRRLVRVTVDDFTVAGEFLGNMLNVNTVEARREIVRNAILNSEMVDA